MNACVREVLREKGHVVHTIEPMASLSRAALRMLDAGVGSLVVRDGDHVVGLLSERDIVLSVGARAWHPDQTAVTQAMHHAPPMIDADTRVRTAMAMMTERRVRHLPVLEVDKLVGLVSIGDLTRWVTRHLEVQVNDLERYIVGDYC